MPPSISICVATDDKITTIRQALASARACPWCAELLVFDSGSTDGSYDLAVELADRVERHEWTNYADSKRRMTEAAAHDWVMILDADEQITPALREEIGRLTGEDFRGHPLMTMPRRNYLLGRHVLAWDPDTQSRLFDRRRVAWPDRAVHDYRLPTEGSVKALRGPLLHNADVDEFSDYFEGQRYQQRTEAQAREMFEQGRRVGLCGLWLRPWAAWFKHFVIKGGFLQGSFGLLVAQKAAFSVQLKYARLWHLQQEGRAQSRGPKTEARDGKDHRN